MEKDKIGRGFKRHCLHMSHGGGRGERIVFSALEGLSFSPFLSSLTFKLFPVCLGFLSSEQRKLTNLFHRHWAQYGVQLRILFLAAIFEHSFASLGKDLKRAILSTFFGGK